MKLIFTHIPKCAGNSISEGILATGMFPKVEYYYAASAEQAVHEIHWQVSSREHQEHTLRYQQFLIQYFMREGADFIYGHLPFSPLAKNFFPDYHWITCLREPVSRFISHLVYLATRYRKDYANRYGLTDGPLLLREIVENIFNDPDHRDKAVNVTALQIGGLGYKVKPDIDNVLSNAIESLKHFSLIGFTEEIDRFFDQLESLIGAPLKRSHGNKVEALSENSTEIKLAREFFDQTKRNEIRAMLKTEIRIYEAAREMTA